MQTNFTLVFRREFDLKEHTTNESLIAAIRSIPYKGGNTATGRALDFVREEMFTVEAGDRRGKVKFFFRS